MPASDAPIDGTSAVSYRTFLSGGLKPSSSRLVDNLFQPVADDPGVHGRFDDRAEGGVVGFNPKWLRVRAVVADLGLLFGAFTLGRAQARRNGYARITPR
ncbi:MAG: hypothetical protein JOZ94_07070 [Xanthobacteraceae bacterium]|nr:hypothetical protein [Xanthobacteraceae bacterium]MBV9631235.1 hypothetical protein [Xanthobacteraceae bacterium]